MMKLLIKFNPITIYAKKELLQAILTSIHTSTDTSNLSSLQLQFHSHLLRVDTKHLEVRSKRHFCFATGRVLGAFSTIIIIHVNVYDPHLPSEKNYIQLMTNWDELKIEQLDWNPKLPLCNLCSPKDILDTIVYFIHILPLHRSHSPMIQ